MKRVAILILVLTMVVSIFSCAMADGTLKINDVNIQLSDSNGKLLSIEEMDGVLYIPVEPFLNALGLPYTINGNSVSITYTPSADNDTDEYANLLPEERVFVDLLMEKAASFKNPSSITVKSILYIGSAEATSQIFITNISAQNGFGGYSSEYYMIMYDGSFALWIETTAEKAAGLLETADGMEQPAFDYGRINRAIQQKVAELGY